MYRSSQPMFEDLQSMQARGLRTVINLRAESDDSRYYCRELGLEYHRYAVEDWNVPTSEQVQEFLDLLQERSRRPVLIHCLAGVGRTGLFVSCYRLWMGMDIEDAIATSDSETRSVSVMNQKQRDWLYAFQQTLGKR